MGERRGAAPDPAGCGWCTAAFSSSVPQMQRERWGPAPDPAGEDDPPRAPSISDVAKHISQAMHRSSEWNEEPPLPGRPAKPARLCASAQEKGWGFPRKQASLFFGNPQSFLLPGGFPADEIASGAYCKFFQMCYIVKAGPGTDGPWFRGPGAEEAPVSSYCELSFCHKSFRRALSVFSSVQNHQGGSRDPWPLVRGSGG